MHAVERSCIRKARLGFVSVTHYKRRDEGLSSSNSPLHSLARLAFLLPLTPRHKTPKELPQIPNLSHSNAPVNFYMERGFFFSCYPAGKTTIPELDQSVEVLVL